MRFFLILWATLSVTAAASSEPCALAKKFHIEWKHPLPHPQALEQFELSALQFLGTRRLGGTRAAMIRDAHGYIHFAHVGQSLGKHCGTISNIAASSITVIELQSDPGSKQLEEVKRVIRLRR